MKEFRVLVVEDDEAYAQSVQNQATDENVIIRTVSSKLDAMAAIKDEFFHAAFVDLHLVYDDPRNVDGQGILAHLRISRPSCKRYLLTKYPETYRKTFFDLLTPLNPTLHGAIDKEALRDHPADVIPPLAKRYLRRPIELLGGTEVLEELKKRGVSGEKVDITLEEIDYLVSSIFGQDADASGSPTDVDDVSEVELSLLGGGRSKSAVVLARPKTKSGIVGIFSVIKIGPKNEVTEEYRRYCRHVRFVVSHNRRVELLGNASGDVLGAICYSFAGRSPGAVRSLGSLFDAEDDKCMQLLGALYSPASKEWLAREGKGKQLASYFVSSYGLESTTILKGVAAFAERIAPEIGARKEGNELIFKGMKLTLPTEGVLGDGRLHSEYASCIVHGDMNPENVLVADDDRVIIIDYRFTGWGPRLLDFAALEGCIRIRPPCVDTVLAEIPRSATVEETVWRVAWREPSEQLITRFVPPYWAKFSLTLKHLARDNFPTATETEYAATCLLWCLRMFRLSRLSTSQRLRLLVWMSFLTGKLVRVSTRPHAKTHG